MNRNIKINKILLQKAKKIIQEKKEKEKYLELCLEANICPICGKELKYYSKYIDEYDQEQGVKCSSKNHFKDYSIIDHYED